MKNNVYNKCKEFKKKFPRTVCWRLKKHCKVIEKHLNSGENVRYVFAGQKGAEWNNIFFTYVVCITNKRIMLAQKRLWWGYGYLSVDVKQFNDLTIKSGFFWGLAIIDTVKEVIEMSNLDKRSLTEIETAITKLTNSKEPPKKRILEPGEILEYRSVCKDCKCVFLYTKRDVEGETVECPYCKSQLELYDIEFDE